MNTQLTARNLLFKPPSCLEDFIFSPSKNVTKIKDRKHKDKDSYYINKITAEGGRHQKEQFTIIKRNQYSL